MRTRTTNSQRSGPPTIDDVAALAGVSKATASRALGHSRDRVSEALTEAVRAAAAELRYVPNRTARALARSKSDTIGLIVHDVSDPYFGEIARGVLAAAEQQDRLVVICNTFRNPTAEARYVAELRAQRVGALLLAGSAYRNTTEQELLRKQLMMAEAVGTSVVVLAPHGIGRAVLPDNTGGGEIAAHHIAGLGHRHVLVAAGPDHLVTITNRLAGFMAVWRAAGLPEPTVVTTTFDRDGGRAAVATAMPADSDITAVFALNDLMAIGAMRELATRGRNIPADVSIVGFDDIPLAADVTPGLTTIQVPMETLGRRAVAVLDNDPEEATSETLPCKLVVRGTTRAPAP